ncbi:MAG TPA: phosphatidate cytidylyltransferase [Burkholderiaceae bacterium]
MLRTRVITAVILLVVLLEVLSVNSFPVLAIAVAAFFFAAAWESGRLFGAKFPLVGAALWTAVLLLLAFHDSAMWADPRPVQGPPLMLAAISAIIWAIRLAPSLALGLPPLKSAPNWLLSFIYCVAILACFVAILVLFQHSALYLFSVMALVWLADIGAYFSGKAFGKRKLAPAISPGKSWEGVIGGWLAVVVLAAGSTFVPQLADTFSPHLLAAWGWGGWLAAMTLIVAASVVGDLFESQLKRRIGMKDSSNLLPGHGGVLDRIDALIPVLPLAVLCGHWM